jgi:hypothetical protein
MEELVLNTTGFTTIRTNELLSDNTLNDCLREGYGLVSFAIDTNGTYVYLFYSAPLDFGRFVHKCPNFVPKEEVQEPIKETSTNGRFMFKNALVGLGVRPQTADDWIKVRKAKRAAQTETAFRTAASQIKIVTDTYGVTPEDVVKVAVERNWQGIMSRYYENVEWSDYGIQVGHTDLPFDDNNKWE